MNFLAPFINYFGKFTKKFDSLSFLNKILLCYIVISIPFLYFHEKHLPFFAVSLLISTTLIVSISTFLISIQIIKFIFKNEFNLFYEFGFVFFSVWLIKLFGFLDNQAGIIFLFFVIVIFLFFRFIRLKLYYQILLIGIFIFINGLLTFKYLQYSEIFLFNKSLESKYQNEAKDFTNWKFDEKTRMLSNEDIPLKLKLPTEFVFHNPKDLEIKEKTGTGQVAGILSSSADPNRYPLIRLFYVEPLINIEPAAIKEEVFNILNFEKTKGNIEEIKLLGEHIFEEKKWTGNFWTFYDIIRPRYSKTGFYVYTLKDGSSIVISIMENLVEGKYHEATIEEILSSIE
jgi:hypothetical protein